MAYVLNYKGKPLMPCGPRKARVLLRDKKAKVIHKTPFTIQLLYGSSGYLQTIVAGLDTGSTVVGSAAVANGKVIYQAEVEIRNDIVKKLKTRSTYRTTRRSNKNRYRPMRSDNRANSTKKGRIPPSVRSKIESHLREVKFVESILPVRYWVAELGAFDIHKITNPEVTGKGYQNGPLKDFYNVKTYVYSRDKYKCQSGQKITHSKKLHAHHVVFRSDGGADTADNLITLCETCHAELHAKNFELKKKGKRSKTKHATEMGIIKSQLNQSEFLTNGNNQVTFGYETKFKREQNLKWGKTHANDAVAICLKDDEIVLPMDTIFIKKHISKGDYKQRSGSRSEKIIPTGKLFGFRKGDKVNTSRGVGFVKGKRSSGYFEIVDLNGNSIHASEKASKCIRISARTTTQVEEIKLVVLLERREKMALIKEAAKVKKEVNQPNLIA